jgi:hypothetical protein
VRPGADLHILENIPPIEPRFLGNPALSVVPILTELPLFIFLLNWKESGRAARRSPVGPLATLPDRWPPYLTVSLSNQSDCYNETTFSKEGSHFRL